MKKEPFRLNFKTKLILIISFFNIVLVILISYLNYFWHSQQVIDQTIDQTQQLIEQLGGNIDTYFDELFRLTLAPYYNDQIMEELETTTDTNAEILTKKRNIEGFLSSVMTLPRSEILRVYIMTDYDIYSYTRTPYEMSDYYTYKEANWYQEALSTTQPIFIPVHSEEAYGETKTQIFSIARKIRSKEDNNITLAVIKVDANYTGIKNICDEIDFKNDAALFVVNDNNDIIYQNNTLTEQNILDKLDTDLRNGSTSVQIDSEEYFCNVTNLEISGLRIIAVNSYSSLTASARKNLNQTIVLVSICIILSTIVLMLFIQRFFKPLFKIIDSMKIVQTGDFSVRVNIKNHDEIGYLATAFNSMTENLDCYIAENQKLIKDVYEAQYLQKETQYNALCSQIKPHFLYNNLNTFSLLIKCEDYEKAIQSIEKFSFYLRGIMNTNKEITLETEIKIIEAYLDIHQVRYENRLTYSIDIEPSLLSHLIPTLTLQPIVENAIKHGCENKREKVHINIHSATFDNQAHIIISDNGNGMPKEKLLEIQSALESSNNLSNDTNKELEESGIGLINIQRRLILKFSGSAGITIHSEDLKGTTITVNLPLSEEK
jgi:two-component system sensor histidine kinase YesM